MVNKLTGKKERTNSRRPTHQTSSNSKSVGKIKSNNSNNSHQSVLTL